LRALSLEIYCFSFVSGCDKGDGGRGEVCGVVKGFEGRIYVMGIGQGGEEVSGSFRLE
jgi:hypothetical protein